MTNDMRAGWFAVKHGIRKHPIFAGRPDRLGAWIAMLDEAAWSETRQNVGGQIITVARGELCASQVMLEEITGLTRKQLRVFLDLLKAEGAIGTRPGTKGAKSRAILTFCNYDKYQNFGPSKGQELAKEGPTKEQDNKTPPSEGAIAPVDQGMDLSSPTTAAWGVGKAYFARLGIKDPGGMVGKFLKIATPVEFLAAIQAADRARTEDPIPYITEALKQKGKPDGRSKWRRGEMRVLSSGRVQEFDGHAWDFRNDLTAADVEAAHA